MRVLRQLSQALQGRPPAEGDWPAIVNLANQSLVTPQLAAALAGAGYGPGEDVGGFLVDVRARNAERNQRLWVQLNDAVRHLNAAGIVPTLLKGAALWTLSDPPAVGDRLQSDIDLLVEPKEVEAAIAALRSGGFQLSRRFPGAAVHVVAELGRPQDVGFIDLHQRPPGPPGLAETHELAERRSTVALEGGWAAVPSPAAQLLYLVLHDHLHDGGYWRGGFDLRHLIDTARLAPLIEPAEWRWLREACGDALVRTALEAHLLSARHLAGASIPPRGGGLAAALTWRRWRMQYAYPRLRLPLAAAAVVLQAGALLAHRRTDRRGRARVLHEAAGQRLSPRERLDRLREIMTVESGKI